MSNLIDVGRITAAYGIKGWVKVHSDTDPSENIFDYQPWQLKTRHGVKPVELVGWRAHGKGYVAQVKGIEDRNQVEALCPVSIAVERSVLPPLDEGEFYWHQLTDCRVISTFEKGQFDFGTVKRVIPTGANDVLVVAADDQSIDQQERLIPYVLDQYIQKIDVDNKEIYVDWDPTF